MILITRNEEKSLFLSKKLQKKGFKTIIYPLFTIIPGKISFLQKFLLKFSKIQAVLLTSSNAIPYLEKIKLDKNIKIFAVGNETATNLQKLGYKNIKKGQNSAYSLLKLAQKNLNKKDLILYLSGEIITQDLAAKLNDDGFKAQKIISYKIKETDFLTNQIIKNIKNNKIDEVVIYSQNTAKIFHTLLKKHDLLKYCKKIKLLCFSDKIVNFSRSIGFTNCQNLNQILI